jgi:hypothetical protein
MCWYSSGVASGYSWEFCTGGGFLLGNLDQAGQLTGPEVTFLYPDLRTGLTGRTVDWTGGQLLLPRTQDQTLGQVS